MAESSKPGGLASFPGGTQLVYGVGIGNALAAFADGRASHEDLVSLRAHAGSIVESQGDLVAAVKALDAEIAKRTGRAVAAPAHDSTRFVAQIDSTALPAKVRDDVEQAIQAAVVKALARIDTGGDLVEAPLSKIASFGEGLGASIRGRYLVSKSLNLG